jgi:hypothetical protein
MAMGSIKITNPYYEVYNKVPEEEKGLYGPEGLLFHSSHATMENAFREDFKNAGIPESELKTLTRYNAYDVIFDDTLSDGKVFITTPKGNRYE